jgi:hypothetical protein
MPFTKAYKKTNGSNFISKFSCKKMEIAARTSHFGIGLAFAHLGVDDTF